MTKKASLTESTWARDRQQIYKHDIAADLVGTLAPRTTSHHAAITDSLKVGALLRASTLRSYIEAMGGKLRLVAEFPNRPPVFLGGLQGMAAFGQQRRAKPGSSRRA